MDETSATSLSEFFDEDFGDVTKLSGDDLFSILESLDDVAVDFPPLDEATTFGINGEKTTTTTTKKKNNKRSLLVPQKSTSSDTFSEETNAEIETPGCSPKRKRAKKTAATSSGCSDQEAVNAASSDGQGKVSHIAVERNRRKQMNEHLTVLRSLMPCFYVKRGDQASIIGGVVDYINELQQVLQSLEAKKQRKIYNEVLSPRLVCQSSRPSPPILSPRKPPLSPRLSLPISPRTPQPGSPYKPRLQQSYLINSPTAMAPNNSSLEPSPTSSSTSSNIITVNDNINELSASSKSEIADVEVKFSGLNLILKTVSPRILGQAAKIIAAIEDLSLEILNVNISTIDETMFHSFTIKIGVECQLSAEELAHHIQQTFC